MKNKNIQISKQNKKDNEFKHKAHLHQSKCRTNI
jgi:hypothetical protein